MHKTIRNSALILGLIALTLIASQTIAAQSAANKGTPFQELWDYITGHEEAQAAETQTLRDEIAALRAETQALQDEVAALEDRVAELEGGAQPPQPQSMTVYIDGNPLDPDVPYITSAGDHVFTIEFTNPTDPQIKWVLHDMYGNESALGEDASFTLTLKKGWSYYLDVEAELPDGLYFEHHYVPGAS